MGNVTTNLIGQFFAHIQSLLYRESGQRFISEPSQLIGRVASRVLVGAMLQLMSNLFTYRAIRFDSTIFIKFLPELVIFNCVVVSCVVVGCHARSGQGMKFHRFPRDPQKRKIWADNVQPNDDSCVTWVWKNTFLTIKTNQAILVVGLWCTGFTRGEYTLPRSASQALYSRQATSVAVQNLLLFFYIMCVGENIFQHEINLKFAWNDRSESPLYESVWISRIGSETRELSANENGNFGPKFRKQLYSDSIDSCDTWRHQLELSDHVPDDARLAIPPISWRIRQTEAWHFKWTINKTCLLQP